MRVDERVQNYPMVDGNTRDSLESLVEIYYQMKGYITSSNKMFWVKTPGKAQRGYQDIDLLAVNAKETYIVSVTSNLNDKVRFARDGSVNEELLERTVEYFHRVEEFLEEVEQYQWLLREREVNWVIAYLRGYRTRHKQISEAVDNWSIELISVIEILKYLESKVKDLKTKGLNPNNDLLRMVQIWNIRREEE